MPSHSRPQFNVRSEFARRRAHELAAATGMTATQVVEEALRAYSPAVTPQEAAGLVRKGRLWVMPARGRRKISMKELNAAIEAAREREI